MTISRDHMTISRSHMTHQKSHDPPVIYNTYHLFSSLFLCMMRSLSVGSHDPQLRSHGPPVIQYLSSLQLSLSLTAWEFCLAHVPLDLLMPASLRREEKGEGEPGNKGAKGNPGTRVRKESKVHLLCHHVEVQDGGELYSST